MTPILGLAGHAGAGKDFMYDRIVMAYEIVGAQARRVAFADGVKLDIEQTLEATLPAVYRKPYKPEVRALLQWWGTELRRAEDPDFWVRAGMARARAEFETWADLVVITDVRFANEAAAIKADGGMVVEVYADPEIRAERLGGSLPPSHASEVIDFEVDARIVNNDTPVVPASVFEFLLDGWV